MRSWKAPVLGCALALSVLFAGCRKQDLSEVSETGIKKRVEQPEVVVYTALDREFSEPILKIFEAKYGIKVKAKYDTESTKTIGLVNAIRNEKDRPRCDVFWNNEILNTIRLKNEGLLEPYQSPSAVSFPATFKDPEGYWTGFAARARIFLVNTDMLKPEEYPVSIEDMTNPRFKGKVGIAKPLFGTTASHAAALFASVGAEKAAKFFAELNQNEVQIESGNKTVALAVSSGRLAFGLTDTDDAIGEVEAGKPVTIVYPDSKPEQMGTLFIPNTLSLVKGSPSPEAAKVLIDYLLSPKVEGALAEASSAQIPVNPQVDVKVRVKTPKEIKAMPLDYSAAAASFEEAATFIRDSYLR